MVSRPFSACKHTVSGSLSLPSRGSFHRSLTVLFTQDFTCPALLWILLDGFQISVTGLLPCIAQFSKNLHLLSNLSHRSPKPLTNFFIRFGLLQFRSPLLPQSLFYFLFLRLLSCFGSAGSPHNIMYSCYDTTT